MTGVRTAYGTSPSQFFERTAGAGRGTLILIHGGWWRDQHDLTLMNGLAYRFAELGWEVINLEYRRTGNDRGGWPQTFEDVDAALDLALASGRGPVVLVGHSAGGQLALLSAKSRSDVTAVIALAPVTDLERSLAENLGEGATALFLRDAVAGDGEPSPLRLLPLGIPYLTVHGVADQRVPVAHSRDFVDAAVVMGDPAGLFQPEGADHFAVIDPAQDWWPIVDKWLDENAPALATASRD